MAKRIGRPKQRIKTRGERRGELEAELVVREGEFKEAMAVAGRTGGFTKARARSRARLALLRIREIQVDISELHEWEEGGDIEPQQQLDLGAEAS